MSNRQEQREKRDAAISRLRDWGIDARIGEGCDYDPRMIEIVYVRRTKGASGAEEILVLDTDAIARDEVHLAEMVRRAGATGVVLSTNHGTPTSIVHRYKVETWHTALADDAPPPEGAALGHPPVPVGTTARTAADLMTAAAIVFGSPDRDNPWDVEANDFGGRVTIPAALVLKMATDTLEEDERLEALAQAALEAKRILLQLEEDHGRQIYVDAAQAITDALAWKPRQLAYLGNARRWAASRGIDIS